MGNSYNYCSKIKLGLMTWMKCDKLGPNEINWFGSKTKAIWVAWAIQQCVRMAWPVETEAKIFLPYIRMDYIMCTHGVKK